jgi:putative acetyltransferase
MTKYVRTDSGNVDFRELVRFLDADLAIRDGDEHAFYAQFNKIAMLQYVVVAYKDDVAIGCGAIKEYGSDTVEVKRMFVPENLRGKGIASGVLQQLEFWAKDLGYTKAILETGVKQPEAIALYHKNGYKITANFGQYEGVENSICFEKLLI